MWLWRVVYDLSFIDLIHVLFSALKQCTLHCFNCIYFVKLSWNPIPMNHFELFNLPVALDISLATLKSEFLKLQQQYHPDKAEDKAQALIQSSEINHAHKVLSQVDSRAAYLLSLKKQDHHLDQSINDFEFLQSALEIREQLEEATSTDELTSLKNEVQQWIDGLVREFKIDYNDEDWAEARDVVRKLRFFVKVMADIHKAEDQLLDDDNFDLDDEF